MVQSFLLIPLVLLFACSKEPCVGGKAEICGRVLEQRYTSSNQEPTGDPYPLPEQNVYIVYGDGTTELVPDDNVDSGPGGDFRFTWLRKGTYTVYVISECGTCPERSKAISAQVELTDRKQVFDIGDLTIENW